MEEKTEYILSELDEVQEIMAENVKQMTNHVVQLEELNDKSEHIRELSETLGKKSRTLKAKECWKVHRDRWIAFGIIVIVVMILTLFIIFSITNEK